MTRRIVTGHTFVRPYANAFTPCLTKNETLVTALLLTHFIQSTESVLEYSRARVLHVNRNCLDLNVLGCSWAFSKGISYNI